LENGGNLEPVGRRSSSTAADKHRQDKLGVALFGRSAEHRFAEIKVCSLQSNAPRSKNRKFYHCRTSQESDIRCAIA
jgi:hypothetical protein